MSEEKMRHALEEVLEKFDIEMEPVELSEEEKKLERRGNYDEIIAKTGEKIDELNIKADELLKETGMTREELEAFCSDPSNFTEEQWRSLQEMKATAEELKKKALGSEEIPVKKKTKKRKFPKKKDWIPL